MIQEAYCSYEVAKLLKEKGFSENTICKYADVEGVIEKWYDDYRERVLRFDWEEGHLIEPLIEPKDQYEIIGDTISAPTHQMAMAWLREKNNIIIVIEPHAYDYPNEKTSSYVFAIWQGDNYMEIYSYKNSGLHGISYPTYEDAVEAALKYSLESLI